MTYRSHRRVTYHERATLRRLVGRKLVIGQEGRRQAHTITVLYPPASPLSRVDSAICTIALWQILSGREVRVPTRCLCCHRLAYLRDDSWCPGCSGYRYGLGLSIL